MSKKKKQNKEKAPKPLPLQEMPTPEFLKKYELEKIRLGEKHYAMRVKDKRPIDKYHRLYQIDKERGIGERYRRGVDEEQFRAADRLSNNFERAISSPSINLDAVRVQTSINVGMFPVESVMHAIHQHARVMKLLSRGSQDIIEEIICKEFNLIDYEQLKGWRKGYGMIRFREALDELVSSYKSLSTRKRA